MNRFDTSHPLACSVRRLDRNLTRPALHRLDLESIQQVVRDLEHFHTHAALRTAEPTHDPQPDLSALVVAGCRLSVDLNEALMNRLQDTLQTHEDTIQSLSGQLKTLLQSREKVNQLLRKTQHLQQQTQNAADAAGLGVIL
jgi:hypothetical protein